MICKQMHDLSFFEICLLPIAYYLLPINECFQLILPTLLARDNDMLRAKGFQYLCLLVAANDVDQSHALLLAKFYKHLAQLTGGTC